MKTLFNVYKEIENILKENENTTPKMEADLYINYIYKKNRLDMPSDFIVSEDDYNKLISFANERKEGYPIQYQLGTWQFFDLELKIGEGVLIPRNDTETVCKEAIDILKEIDEPNIMDLCSGSGAIALAIKKYVPNSFVTAVEKYEEAYKYLEQNIKDNNLNVLSYKADVFTFDDKIEDETFDMIIANPPYVDPAYKEDLQKEVTFEPETSLFADDYGLRFYKYISKYYYKKIKYNGYLVFEHGFDQHEYIKNIIEGNGYIYIKEITDINGISRGLVAQKK